MSKHPLEILFDSKTRVKIMKYVFRNADASFTIRELANHTQEDISTVKQEVSKLREIGFLVIKKENEEKKEKKKN